MLFYFVAFMYRTHVCFCRFCFRTVYGERCVIPFQWNVDKSFCQSFSIFVFSFFIHLFFYSFSTFRKLITKRLLCLGCYPLGGGCTVVVVVVGEVVDVDVVVDVDDDCVGLLWAGLFWICCGNCGLETFKMTYFKIFVFSVSNRKICISSYVNWLLYVGWLLFILPIPRMLLTRVPAVWNEPAKKDLRSSVMLFKIAKNVTDSNLDFRKCFSLKSMERLTWILETFYSIRN